MAEGLRIPITVDFKNSLQKLNEAKKYFSDLASGAEKSLGTIGTSAASAAAALTPLAQAAASARASIVAFGEGKENIEQVIPLFQELVAQAGGIDQAFEQLQDIPFFEEFVRGAEEAVLAAERLDGKDVKIDINAEGLESVRTQLREARTELDNAVLKFGELSPEADAAAKKVAELNDVIETSGRRAQGADLKGKFELAGRAIAGVAAAFQTVTALQAVFGSESKKTEEALKKVQAVMALTQGIEGVLSGVEAFKTLGIAASGALKGISKGVAATGIGLFVVALGTVVAYWDDIAEAVGRASDEQERFNKTKKNLETISQNAIKNSADETVKLNILYQATQDNTIALSKRKQAVDELQRIYPDYFGNLTDEAILTGSAKTAYDQLTASILRKATAEAASEKITELFKSDKYLEAKTRLQDLEKQLKKTGTTSQVVAGDYVASLESYGSEEQIRQQRLLQSQIQDTQNVIAGFETQAKDIVTALGVDNIVDAFIGKPDQAKAQAENVVKSAKTSIDSGLKTIQGKPIEIPVRLSRLEELNERLKELKDKQLKVNTALEFQQLQGQIDSVQGEIDGITSVKPLKAPVFIGTVILPPEREGIERLENARKTILDDQEAFQEKYTALVESGLEDAFEAFGTAIGEGQDPFAALGKSIGLSLANFATQLGKDLVVLGKLFASIQAALKGLGPGAKIAVGLALIAFGAAVKAAISKRGKEQGFARGGYIDGPGTETSDSIPARLSKGEYVVRARVVKRYGKNFFERLNNNLLPPPSVLARQANDETLAEAVKQFGRNGGSTKALVNRFEAPLLFANGGYVGDFWENIISRGRSGGSSKALVNRFEVPDFGQMSQPAMPRMQTSTEPQIIATTKVSGQDLKIILERADKRYSSVT